MVGKRSHRLTDAFIRSIKEPCKHGDGNGGHGLTIVARDRASGGLRLFWRQAFTIDGKKRSTGLGRYPLVTLKVARGIAFDNARKLTLGDDILNPKRVIPTMGEAFDQFIADHTPEWKTERQAHSERPRIQMEIVQTLLQIHTLQKDLSRHPR